MVNHLTEQPEVNQRRLFLKHVVLAGSAISTPLLSTNLLAENYPSFNKSCDFSSLAKNFIYLNSGTEGSMPKCVLDELNSNFEQWASDPTRSYESDNILGKHQHFQRQQVANVFSVEKDNICLTDNTTMGISMVLMGLNFSSSDKVIFTNHEHTAVTSPLTYHKQKNGLNLVKRHFPKASKLAKMDEQQVIDFLFPNIEALRNATALCISHVYPSTGIRLPLKTLRDKANQLNIKYLIVDGAQAFGMIDITQGNDDIKHSDFYACPGHKWLNGPPSTGILYIKNASIKPPEFYPTLSQRMEKFIDSDSKFAMAEALQVRGCSNAPGFAAMLRAIKFHQELGGATHVEERIIKMSTRVKNMISKQSSNALVSPYKDSNISSGLTVFFVFNWNTPTKLYQDKKTADFVVEALLKKNIQIRSIGFYDSDNNSKKSYALRVSTGIFNNDSDLDRFFLILKEILSKLLPFKTAGLQKL